MAKYCIQKSHDKAIWAKIILRMAKLQNAW